MIIRTAILLLTISLAGCAQEAPAAGPPAAADTSPVLVVDATPEQIEAGKRIVELQCISCHAVRADDKGHNPNAPALRTLAERYPVTGLEEAFALGIMTGHPGMPEFRFRPDQIKAILAYIESIQTRRGA